MQSPSRASEGQLRPDHRGSPRRGIQAFENRREQTFPVLTTAQIARLAPMGVEEEVEDGTIVVEQGQTDVPFIVVLAGALEIVSMRSAVEHSVTTHDVGHFTGELTLLARGRSLVRARARGETRLLRIDGAALRALVQTDGELSEILVRAFILRRVGLLSEGYGDALLVGSAGSAATHRLRSFLGGNAYPHEYIDVDHDCDVADMLDELHVTDDDLPILVCHGERLLRNPTDLEVAESLGIGSIVDPQAVHDVVICGAGPGGLAAAVYAASEGLDVLVVEGTAPGGQAGSSSKIENYLGFPTGISGQALAARAAIQAEKFGARISVARRAERLHCDETPMRVTLSGGVSVRARAIIVATGAEYETLDLEDVVRFRGAGIYHAATALEAQSCASEEVVVVGGGNSAGQAATFLARSCAHVHVLVRRPDLSSSMSRYLIRRIEETSNITLHGSTRVIGLHGDDSLEHVTWRHEPTGDTTERAIRHVFMMTGARPRTEWLRGCVALDEKGFVRTGHDLSEEILARAGWRLARQPYIFETSRPRVFAIGDARANSVKRVASAVGEGAICTQLVHYALAE